MTRKTILLILLIGTLCRIGAQPPTATFAKQHTRATFYSDRFEGRRTASGDIFRQSRYTAAHKSLPFGTLVLVTNPKNGRQVIVKINDRCPKPGLLDLTRTAARQIGITSHPVDIQILTEDYHHFWEHQEKYLSSLNEGTFLEMAHTVRTFATDPPIVPPQPVVPPSPHKSAKQEPPHQEAKPKQPLFDLEICTISLNSETTVVVERLPIHYRNKAYFHTIDDEIHVRLSLSMTQDELKEVQRDLYPLFPRSKPIPQL